MVLNGSNMHQRKQIVSLFVVENNYLGEFFSFSFVFFQTKKLQICRGNWKEKKHE